jgi:hypothetical protein
MTWIKVRRINNQCCIHREDCKLNLNTIKYVTTRTMAFSDVFRICPHINRPTMFSYNKILLRKNSFLYSGITSWQKSNIHASFMYSSVCVGVGCISPHLLNVQILFWFIDDTSHRCNINTWTGGHTLYSGRVLGNKFKPSSGHLSDILQSYTFPSQKTDRTSKAGSIVPAMMNLADT